MNKLRLGLFLILLVAFTAQPVFSKCFIFVHGHQSTDLTPAQAYDYWNGDGTWYNPYDNDRDTLNIVAAGANNKYAVVNWNSTIPYWQAAKEVADQINNILAGGSDGNGASCAGQSYFRIVSHSNGGPLMDWIFGNSRPSDPYYNYAGGNYANINNRVYRHLSIQGAHRGTYAADTVCGNGGAVCNFLAGIISDCDQGTVWLQTADSYQVRTYANSPGTTTWLFGGYEMIVGASACLAGEDDGVIAYPSAFACSGSATANYNTSNLCTSKQESAGFRDAGQFDENHDGGRNGNDQDTVKAVYGGLWGSTSTGTNVRSSDSSATIIHEVWAD